MSFRQVYVYRKEPASGMGALRSGDLFSMDPTGEQDAVFINPNHIFVAESDPFPLDEAGAFEVNSSRLVKDMDFWKPGKTLDQVEREAILAALEFHNGNRTRTARELKISSRMLHMKIGRYRQEGHFVPPSAAGHPRQAPEKKDVGT